MTQLQFNKWKTKYMSDVEHCYETLSDRRDRPPPAKAEIGAMKILKLEFDKLLVDKRFVPIHRLIKKSFHQFADEINSHLSGYETWGTRNRSHGRRRFPKMLVIDLLQVLEHAKNNRTSLDMIYDFLKPSGELEMWHNLKYKNQKRKISFRIPTKDAHSPTQWAQ